MTIAKKKPVEKPREFDLVIVEWLDAMTIAGMQVSAPEEAVERYVPCVRRSTGYFCGQTKDITVIAGDDDRDSLNPKALGGISYIPTSLVRSIRVVGPTVVRFK